jgi:parvulin-like peptidyl-prolyl isomerase
MYKTGKALLAIILLGALFGPSTAQAQTKTLDQIIAWVNNEVILKSEYDRRLQQVRSELADPQRKGGALKGPQLEQAFNDQANVQLQRLIDESLLMQQAKDMGFSADIEVVKAMDKLRQDYKLPTREALEAEIVKQMPLEDFTQDIRVKYLTSQVLQREVYGRVIISSADMNEYYESHVKDFDRPAGVRLREITVITENRGPEEIASQRKKMEEALAAVKKGDDFSEVAAKYSESQTAGEGGDLGFFVKGELSQSLEDIVNKLDKGKVSDIFSVQGAFMIVKLDEKHDGGILPYELAQKEIQDILWNKALPPKIKEYLTKLRDEGFVKTADGYTDTGAPEKTSKISETNADGTPVLEKEGQLSRPEDAKPAKRHRRWWALGI